MRRLTLYLALAILAFIVGINTAALWTAYRLKSVSTTQVLSLSEKLHETLIRRDVKALDNLLADDLVITRTDGSVIGKAEWLSDVKDYEFTIDSITTDSVQINVNGDEARVAGVIKVIAHFEDRKPIDHESRFIYSFARRQGVWRIVSIRAHR